MIASFKPIWRRSDDESVSLIIHFAVILSVCLSMTAVSVAADSKSPAARTRVSGPKPKPVKPRVAKDVERAIERGVAFLLKDQNEPGSWGSPHQTKGLNIYAPVPGAHHAFRTAVTAMCVTALIEVDSDRKDVLAAIERGEAWLLERLPRLRRATPDALRAQGGQKSFEFPAIIALTGPARVIRIQYVTLRSGSARYLHSGYSLL